MNQPYTVIEIKPEWRLDQEQMGSKRKFWYSEAVDQPRWLFKYAREIVPGVLSGEHWAEKIAEQIAEKMGVYHAKVELAVFEGSRGSTSESFVNGKALVHGNEILHKIDDEYKTVKNFKQSQHSLERIFKAFDEIFKKPAAEANQCWFAEYLVLDALISNVDRHHENWGILLEQFKDKTTACLAPSFDHASSLGRELTDARRQQILQNNGIGQYVKKGHGAIFWDNIEKKAPPPLNLVNLAVVRYPAFFQNVFERLDYLTTPKCETIIDRVPDDWMSPCARVFAKELLRYNLEQLQNLRNKIL